MNAFSKTNVLLYRAAAALFIAMLVLAVLPVGSAHALACTFTSNVNPSGNWSASGSWTKAGSGCSTYPGQTFAGDTVVISSGDTITLDVSPANPIDSLTFPTNNAANAAVNFNSGTTLNVSTAVTIPRATSGFMNTLAVGAGTLNAGSIAFTNSGITQRHQVTITTGTVSVTGNVTVDTLGNASPTITFTGAGLLKLGGGLWSGGGGTLTTVNGSTVEYNGSAAQTVMAHAYSNLTLSGSGVKTMPATTSVTTTLRVAPTGSATASIAAGQNLPVNSLALGGLGRINGTWGSTSSTATYKNNSYFAATTGFLTVANDTRTAATVTTWPTASGITYGQALSASTLSGGSAPAGTFAFTTPSTKPNAGTYSAPVTFTASDTTSYNPATTSGNVNVQVAKAEATCTVSGFAGVYNAAAHGASGSCSGIGGESAGTLNLGATFTNVPGGTANWAFTGNGNYNNQAGSVAITITKADASCTVDGYTGVYDATAHGANGSCTGVGGATITGLTLGAQFTDAPGGTANWSFSNANYNDQASSVAIDITKADATCAVTGFSGQYDAAAHGASGSCLGVGGEDAGTLDLGLSFIDVPGGTADWAFTGNSNYNDQAGSVAIDITKADAACAIAGFTGKYDAAAHGASGSCPGVGGENAGTLELGASFTDFPGGTADWAFTGTNNYSDQTGSVAIDITKADAACTITGFSGAYDAAAHGASGSCPGVGGENAGSLDLGLSFTNVPGGTADWAFTGNNNYSDQTGSVAIDISKADAACAITGFSGSYDAAAHGASGSCPGVGGENAGTLELGASFTDFPGGTADWAFTGNSNYNDQAGSVAIDITKADAAVVVLPYTVTYDGSAHSSTGTATGVSGEDLSANLDLSATSHTDAGSYAGDVWTFTAPNANYNDAFDTVDNNIVTADADCSSIAGYAVTFDGAEHIATGSCKDVVGDPLAGLDLSLTAHTAIGTYSGDAWTFTDVTGNYNDASGTVDSVISAKLIPEVTATGGPFMYDGNPHAADVTSLVAGTVSNVQYDGSLTVPQNAGTYAVTANFLPDDTAAYETLTDASVGSITINKADASCTVTGYSVTYDGAEHIATGSCLGVGSSVLTGLNLDATKHTDIGSYPGDAWTFTDITGNYKNTSGTVDNVISAFVDTTAPVVASVVRTDADNTSAPSVNFTVSFSEAVSGVDPLDFALSTTGDFTGASVTGVTGSGSDYTVSVNTWYGIGTIRLDVVDNNSITDLSGNPLGGPSVGDGNFNSGQAYTINKTATNQVAIGGTLQGSYTIPSSKTMVTSYAGIQNGPVKVTSTNSSTFFTSQRVIAGTSFNEVMGYPTNQLTTEYWFPWYDNLDMATWVLVGNASSTQSAAVDIYIGGVKRGSYIIGIGGRVTPRFPLKTGPVRVVSTNGVKIFTSERTQYGPNSAFNEVMGYPANQFTTEYWFPWYDNTSMSTWILVGNPSTTSSATVDIYIGGAKKGTYSIPKGGQITPRFNIDPAGPVRVVSTNDMPIFSSERTIAGDSFNEVMGSPANQFTTEYWYPWYDNVGMGTWVLVGNPTGNTAAVDIYIGGIKQASYNIGAGKQINQRFPLNTGPVRVVSTNGVKIFSSERVLYGTSFNEVMGYAGNKLTTEYWFPWYDSTTMSTDILVGKP